MSDSFNRSSGVEKGVTARPPVGLAEEVRARLDGRVGEGA